jgi:hypothetical protein
MVQASSALEGPRRNQARRDQHPPVTDSKPDDETLRLALAENWAHARHMENLRERLNYLYWITWPAVLVFVSSDAANNPSLDRRAELAVVFLFVAIASAIALFANLKWTSEFANHVMAAALCAQKLGLNTRGEEPERKTSLDRLWVAGSYLPFGSLAGYMALPLPAPIFLTVGALMPMVECLGVGLAVGFLVGNLDGALNQVGITISPIPQGADIAVGLVVAAAMIRLARWTQVRAQAEIQHRYKDVV